MTEPTSEEMEQAGWIVDNASHSLGYSGHELRVRIAAALHAHAEAERERCAKIVEEGAYDWADDAEGMGRHMAAAIRAGATGEGRDG